MSDSTKSSLALVEKFVIRLPKGLREQIKALSENKRRSMNSEIIMVLEKHIKQSMPLEDMQEFSNESFIRETQHPMSADDQHARGTQASTDVLQKRLDALPPEKKEALLELLG